MPYAPGADSYDPYQEFKMKAALSDPTSSVVTGAQNDPYTKLRQLAEKIRRDNGWPDATWARNDSLVMAQQIMLGRSLAPENNISKPMTPISGAPTDEELEMRRQEFYKGMRG